MSVEICNSISAPKDLDEQFFQDTIENGLFESYVKIKKLSFEKGSDVGDNYCSQIYRVRVTYQSDREPLESVSVVVKSIPVSDNTQFLEDMKVFLKEKIVYYNMMPRMEILLDKVKFGPKLYHTLKEPINTLVFEDLSSLGYIMADREQGLDLAHSKVVMKKLGQFHGVSMVLHKKDPASMNSFRSGILRKESVYGSDLLGTFFGNNINGLIHTIKKWKGFESISEKVEKYAADLKQNLVKSQQPIDGELKVLNHGDLWVNNFLFKYKNGEKQQVDDVVFVDFQMSIFGSPGYDINYFLFTSVQLEVLEQKREEMLQTYYAALRETLKTHSFNKIPSFEDILTEVRRRESYGFFANFAIFPAIAMDKAQSGDNTLDNFMNEDFAKKKVEIMFSSKRLEETMRYTLKRFDEMGIFD